MTQLTLDFLARQANEEAPFQPDVRQQALTERHLEPNKDAIFSDLLRLRAEFDCSIEHSLHQHPRLDQYPTGFCLEITKGVLRLINRELANPTTPAMHALRRFCEQGGCAKRVWGNLRHQYFQNAIQIGSLYVDVANDSVDRNKPKVEILPMSAANFYPLSDYDSYSGLAERYWKAQAYPNRYLPPLAPLFPLLLVYPNGKIQLHSAYQMLLYQNMLSDFTLAEEAIFSGSFQDRRLPSEILQQLPGRWKPHLNNLQLSTSPVQDDELRQSFTEARETQLRLDAIRCQNMLNLFQRLS